MRADAIDKAERARDSASLELLARLGLIAYGIVHLLIGWLALQLAWGGGNRESAGQSGALATLAEKPLGNPLLWGLGLGHIPLAVRLAPALRPLGARRAAVGGQGEDCPV